MWFEVMRETEQRVYSSRGLKLQSGYALLPFQTPGSFSALVGIHLKKEKSCLKKGPTSLNQERKLLMLGMNYRILVLITQNLKKKRLFGNELALVYVLLIVSNQYSVLIVLV